MEWGRVVKNRDTDLKVIAGSAESEEALDVRPEELQEFLAADFSGVKADPEFKERLREKLWAMVKARRPYRADRRH